MCSLAVLIGLVSQSLRAAEPPRLRELRTQQVGDVTYFHVRFERPAGIYVPEIRTLSFWERARLHDFGKLPELVPADNQTHSVYVRVEAHNASPRPGDSTVTTAPVRDLEFIGKCNGATKAKFRLIYAIEKTDTSPKSENRRGKAYHYDGVEIPVELELDKAQKTAAPAVARDRKPSQPPNVDDLEGLWASAQATRFGILEALSPEFSFYSYAREATSRKYHVPDVWLGQENRVGSRMEHERLYETTTGAAAVAESLQLERMLRPNSRDKGERRIDIGKVAGIDIAEHPWQQMMGENKPADEPIAQLVPSDQYYISFRNIRKFMEMMELMQQWGTNLTRAYQIPSRGYQLKERYEQQLCLRSTALGKALGPQLIRSLAVTGSDGYLREGTDITLIFAVVNRDLFRAAVNPFIDEARAKWGSSLKTGHDTYHDVPIETFITPFREVSLQRTAVGDFVIYSNSPAAVRRVIDTYQHRRKSLADSLDFRYMRTVFRADQNEDGFAFLSDPFIRQLVGPASKIKEKRRLEALTSLYMITNDALFRAWERSDSSSLKPEDINTTPSEGPVTWDKGRRLAVSHVYGTLQFATPLIELPIDRVTEMEEREYQTFRGQYLGLWRAYFDPIGIRCSLSEKEVRIETYILPLIKNSQYVELRQRTGNGTIPLEVNGFAPKTILQITSHISSEAPERGLLLSQLRSLGALGAAKGLDWLGDWFLVRLDDSEMYEKIFRLEQSNVEWSSEVAEALFQVPLTMGVGIKNPLVFAGVLTALRGAVNQTAPGMVNWDAMDPPYKGTTIVCIRAGTEGLIPRVDANDKRASSLRIYYANVDGGWYVSLREDCIKEVIDRSIARKEGKLPKSQTVDVNSSLYAAPGAAEKTKAFVKFYLEWQTHDQAQANIPLWYALYRSGVLSSSASEAERRETAMRYFGFIPVSADGAAYDYDSPTDEVTNRRHGTLRRPQFQSTLDANKFLESLENLRVDLRFREDGVNTVLSIQRKTK
jgi:hypothetical protein